MAKKSKKKDSGKKSEAPAEESRSAGYPWWARITVGLVVFFWGGIALSFIVGMSTAVAMMRDAPKPEFIKETLAKVVRIDELPKGFKYQFAVSAMGANMVALVHEPEQTFFLLSALPKTEQGETSRTLADKLSDQFIPSISADPRIDKKGDMIVAGETLEYLLGSSSDRQGRKLGGFIGSTVFKNRSAFLAYGFTHYSSPEPGSAPGIGAEKGSGAGSGTGAATGVDSSGGGTATGYPTVVGSDTTADTGSKTASESDKESESKAKPAPVFDIAIAEQLLAAIKGFPQNEAQK